jgi:hypothetical protein
MPSVVEIGAIHDLWFSRVKMGREKRRADAENQAHEIALSPLMLAEEQPLSACER